MGRFTRIASTLLGLLLGLCGCTRVRREPIHLIQDARGRVELSYAVTETFETSYPCFELTFNGRPVDVLGEAFPGDGRGSKGRPVDPERLRALHLRDLAPPDRAGERYDWSVYVSPKQFDRASFEALGDLLASDRERLLESLEGFRQRNSYWVGRRTLWIRELIHADWENLVERYRSPDGDRLELHPEGALFHVSFNGSLRSRIGRFDGKAVRLEARMQEWQQPDRLGTYRDPEGRSFLQRHPAVEVTPP